MKTDGSSIRELLSLESQQKFDDVTTQRVLGASNHIRLISEMIRDLCAVAKASHKTSAEIVRDTQRLIDFFKNTRGKASQAISNALDMMTSKLDEKQDADSLILQIQQGIDNFHNTNNETLEKINQYALTLLTEMKSVLLFDYSSTVGRLIESTQNTITVFLPESRILNGGKPYIPLCQKAGHMVHFIPDASMLYYLKECDGVFIGSETLYPDGRVFNTIGSELLACVCNQMNVPFYVLTTLLKIDMRPLTGYQKPPVIVDVKEKYADVLDLSTMHDVDFSSPELVEIPAAWIRALITEKGIVPPSAIFQLASEYAQKMKGNA